MTNSDIFKSEFDSPTQVKMFYIYPKIKILNYFEKFKDLHWMFVSSKKEIML